MLIFPASEPRGLFLVRLWCWLNVVAMLPTLSEPAVVLFGFAARGPDAFLIKLLILANAIAITVAISLRIHPGRLALLGWMPFMFVSALCVDLIPSCPPVVKIAVWQHVLFGTLIPYLYVTIVPTTNFLPMHVANAAVMAFIAVVLIRQGRLFRWLPLRARPTSPSAG